MRSRLSLNGLVLVLSLSLPLPLPLFFVHFLFVCWPSNCVFNDHVGSLLEQDGIQLGDDERVALMRLNETTTALETQFAQNILQSSSGTVQVPS